MLRLLRSLTYRLGFRPEPGSLLFSPSLAMLRSLEDADIPGAIARGFDSVREPDRFGLYPEDYAVADRALARAALGCCGACPPIEGGGVDCTCAGNPRCPAAVLWVCAYCGEATEEPHEHALGEGL